jgi:hypothetical protein
MGKDSKRSGGGSQCALQSVSLVNIVLSATICAYGAYMAYMSDVTYMASGLAALGGLVVLMSMIGFWGGKNETHWMLLGVSCALNCVPNLANTPSCSTSTFHASS